MFDITLTDEPRGSGHRGLLEFCASRGVSASVVVRNEEELGPDAQAFAEVLAPLGLRRSEVSEWPGTRLLEGSATLWVFRWDREAVDAVLSVTSGLFDWIAPRLPEDLAVYRADGEWLLGSISHERMRSCDSRLMSWPSSDRSCLSEVSSFTTRRKPVDVGPRRLWVPRSRRWDSLAVGRLPVEPFVATGKQLVR